jgi:3-hydroxybutyryl-CoA dehydrogenase
MPKIVVIGTGTMAAGIAAGFIAEQYSVVILGRSIEKAGSCLAKAIAFGSGPWVDRNPTSDRIN